MSDFDLARSMLNHAAPGLMQDYISVVSSSDDPEDKRKALELAHKLNQKDGPQAGVVVNFTFDMSNGFVAKTTPLQTSEVVELPPPTAPVPTPLQEEQSLDLAAFFAVDER